MTKYVSNQLFSNPSFIEGVSSVLDLSGTLHNNYNSSKTECEADKKAMSNDWHAIGDDIKKSISNYEQKLTK